MFLGFSLDQGLLAFYVSYSLDRCVCRLAAFIIYWYKCESFPELSLVSRSSQIIFGIGVVVNMYIYSRD